MNIYKLWHKIIKYIGLLLELGWVTIQGLDVDAVATNTVKSQKWRNGASKTCFGGKKEKISKTF